MEKLVQELKNAGVLKTKELVDAFLKTDRRDFVLPEYQSQAYEDYPLPIGKGQTISQPYTVAFMLELLNPQKGDKILDVGSGSGWTTALLANVAGKEGRVYGVELVPELVQFGKQNLAKYALAQAEIVQAQQHVLGLPEKAPFDRILVSAAARDLPKELLSQLKENGALVLPVGDAVLKIQRFEGFAFVPLLSGA